MACIGLLDIFASSKPTQLYNVVGRERINLSPLTGSALKAPGNLTFSYENDSSSYISPYIMFKKTFKLLAKDTLEPLEAAAKKIALSAGVFSGYQTMIVKVNGVVIQDINNLPLSYYFNERFCRSKEELQMKADLSFLHFDVGSPSSGLDNTEATNTGFATRCSKMSKSDEVFCVEILPLHFCSAKKFLPPGVRIEIILSHASDERRLFGEALASAALVAEKVELIIEKNFVLPHIFHTLREQWEQEPIIYNFKRTFVSNYYRVEKGVTSHSTRLWHGQRPLAAVLIFQDVKNVINCSFQTNQHDFANPQLRRCSLSFEGSTVQRDSVVEYIWNSPDSDLILGKDFD